MEKDGWVFSTLKKEGGKLVHDKSSDKKLYDEFVKALAEGQTVEVFFDANVDDATLARLAKVHKCIRVLAVKGGFSFADMKHHVKKRAGLCVSKVMGDDVVSVCKSFGTCSKDEIDLAIQAAIELGDGININLR